MANAQNTRITGTFETQDQLTPVQAKLDVLACVSASTGVFAPTAGACATGTAVYGRGVFFSVDTGRNNAPREITCGGVTHPPQAIPVWIKGDGTLLGGDEVAGVLLIPTAGCDPAGLAYELSDESRRGLFFNRSTVNRRPPHNMPVQRKAIPAQASVDWASLSSAPVSSSVSAVQMSSQGNISDFEKWVRFAAASVPAAASGQDNVFIDLADAKLKARDSAGVLRELGGAGGSGDITDVGDCATGACFQSQAINQVFASPSSGGAGIAAFRALVEADIPALAQSKITNLVSDLAGKQPLDPDLTAIAALGTTGYAKRTGADAWSLVGTIPETDLDAALLRDVEAAALYLPLAGGTLTGELIITEDGRIRRDTAADTSYALYFEKRGSLGGGGGAAVASGAELGYVNFTGWDGATYGRGAFAIARAEENFSGSAHGARYSIWTTTIGTTTEVERLRISSAGIEALNAMAFIGPLTGNVTGNASTATALAANGANCAANEFNKGVDASGAAESCAALATADVDEILAVTHLTTYASVSGTGTVALAVTLTSLADDHLCCQWDAGTSRWENFTFSYVFADDVFRIEDNADGSKELAFELSGLTTATTRTVTPFNGASVIPEPRTCSGTDKVSAISAAGVVTCSTDELGAGGGDAVEVEDSDDAGTFTAVDTTARFEDQGDINFVFADGGAGGPDTITALIRANVVGPAELDETAAYAFSSTSNTFAGASYSSGADPADAGAIRLSNAEKMCWESSPADAAEFCISVTATEMLRFDRSGTPYLEFEFVGNSFVAKLNPAASDGQWTRQGFDIRDGLLSGTANPGRYTGGGDTVGTALTWSNGAESSLCTGKFDDADNCPTSGGGDLVVWDERAAGSTLLEVLAGASQSGALVYIQGASPLQFEGATADGFETTVAVTDPTADRTFTIPNADSVAIQPLTCSGTDKVSAVSAAGVITCSADADSGGTPAWEALVNTADTATAYTSNNTAETVTFNFEAAFTTGTQFLIRQQTGNPTGGTVFGVESNDANVPAAHFTREDASTSTSLNIVRLFRSSTGTPAAGIGGNLSWHIETAAGNTEVGAILDVVTTDVGSGTEDFDYVFKLMAGGAAAAEAARITSGGVVNAAAGFQIAGAALNFSHLAGTADESQLDANVVLDNASNTWSTGTQDFTAVTALLVKSAAGYAPTADASFGYDTTGDKFVGGGAGAITGSFPRVLSITRPAESKTNSVTSDQDYASVFTIPANYLDSGRCVRVTFGLQSVTGVSTATTQTYIKLGSTKVYTSVAGSWPDSFTRSGARPFYVCGTAAPGASVNVDTFAVYGSGSAMGNDFNNTTQPVALATNGTLTVVFGVTWSATGSTDTLELRQAVVEEVLHP